jgi:hypothetical protein
MMRMTMPWVCALLVAFVGGLSAAPAQDSRIEVTVGATLGLLSQEMSMEEDTSWNFQVSYLASPTFSWGVVYEQLDTIDNLDRRDPETDLTVNGDVSVSLYGVSALWVLAGDPEFEIFAVAAMGRGSLDYEDPLPAESELRNETDIDLWYEFGGGSRFALGENWNLRIQVTFRRISPAMPSVLLEQSEGGVFPSFLLSRRF